MKSIRRQSSVALGVAATCCLLAIATARAQQPAGGENYLTRIQRTWPILRPTFDAPTATVRRLAFSSDPTTGELRLYCAGDDKLVHRWKLTEQADETLTVETEPSIVWPIHTEVRGVIYALDVCRRSDGDLLAFGGAALKGPEVCLASARTEAQQILLPSDSVTNANVVAVDLSEVGTSLAVCHLLGDDLVRLWNIAPNQQPTVQPLKNLGLTSVRWLKFSPDGLRLVIVGGTERGKQVVQVWNARTLKRELSTSPIDNPISAVGWRDNGSWLATHRKVSAGPAIVLGDLRNAVPKQNELPSGVDLTTLAVKPAAAGKAVLAVAEWNPAQLASRIVVRDPNRPGSKVRELVETFNNEVAALAISPDGRFVAAAGPVAGPGGHLHQVRVWNVESGRLVAQLPDDGHQSAAGGPIARVGVITGKKVGDGTKPSDQIAWAWGPYTERGAGGIPFTRKLTLLARDNRRPLPPLSEPIELNDQQADRGFARVGNDWFLTRGAKEKTPWGPLPRIGAAGPSCFAVQEDFDLLAIGSVDGILVCRLSGLQDAGSKFMQRRDKSEVLREVDRATLRGFYGHAGRITSLSFSTDKDVPWLASAGEDGIICAWGLGALDGQELDLAVANQGGRLVVTADPGPYSPAWEAGFTKGMVVRKLTVFGRGSPTVIDRASDILNALTKPVPGQVINAIVRPPATNEDKKLTTRAMRDPFWTLYPQLDGNWCLWTPDGHFDCTKGCRDRLRYHVNLDGSAWRSSQGIGESARLFPIGAFRELFFEDAKPGEAVVDNAVRIKRPLTRPEFAAPPKLDLVINESNGAVQLDARPAEGTIESVSIWLNGGKLAEQQGASIRATIPRERLRSSGNTVAGVARLRVGSGSGATIVERNVIRPTSLRGAGGVPRVHFLGVGVTALDNADKFAEAKPPLVPLRFAHNDALSLAGTLRQGALAFEPGSIAALVHEGGDGLPTEGNIRSRLAQLAEAVAPDDLAIVLLAGHGKRDPGQPFRFIAEDSVPGGGVTDAAINEALSNLSCRTLLLLDTCHSGQAVTEQQLLNWPGMGLGPVVVAACRAGEESSESDSLGVGDEPAGHGMFTATLLEPLTGIRMLAPPPSKRGVPAWDRDSDGQLTLGELFEYLDDRTDQMRQELRVAAQHSVVIRSVTFKDADALALMPALQTPNPPPAGR